ncbi:MAG: catalase, partial [Actinomycetota bacterium]|nr:catalase [Actinomycetota bacterium]
QMAYHVDDAGSNPHVNYEPNSTGGLAEADEPSPAYEPEISGRLTRSKLSRTNDYVQAGERYRTMPDWERDDLVLNLVDLLGQCDRHIQERMVEQFARCDEAFGRCVATGIGLRAPAAASAVAP